jgi:hypothetical protein
MQKEKPMRTTLYLPVELWKRTKIEAIKRDCDATDIVVWALEAYLKTKGGRP